MSFFTKCLSEERAEASYFSAIFSIFSAISASCAVFNNEWITIRNTDTAFALRNNSMLKTKLIPFCSRFGARLFWTSIPPENYVFFNNSSQLYSSSFRSKDTNILVYTNCISPTVAYLFYCAISLCFVIVLISICAAALHVFLPPSKFLQWLRKCVVLESCNVLIMFIVCFLTWRAKHEIETHLIKTAEVCVGSGMFYIICSGAFSLIAGLFSFYQNKLIGRARRAENQRFICTRALRSWRDHVENNRLVPGAVNRPTELERYLLGASTSGAHGELLPHQRRSDTISSTMTIVPTGELDDHH